MRQRREPKVRADGLCVCGCGRELPRSPQAYRYAGHLIDSDPFATSVCARAYYGTTLPPSKQEQERERRRIEREGEPEVVVVRRKPGPRVRKWT